MSSFHKYKLHAVHKPFTVQIEKGTEGQLQWASLSIHALTCES